MRHLTVVLVLCGALAAGQAYAESTGMVTLKYSSVNPGSSTMTSVDYGASWQGAYLTGVYNLKIVKWLTNSNPKNPNGMWADYLDSDGDGKPDQEASELVYGAPSAGTETIGGKKYDIGSVASFCMDVLQEAPTSYKTYYIYELEDAPIGGANNPIGPTKAADLRKLWSNCWGYVLTGGVVNGTTYTKDQAAAAMQASVWEIVYEETTSYGMKTGSFRTVKNSESVTGWKALANYWLGQLSGWSDDPSLGMRAVVSEGYQDFAIVVPGVGAEPVPEPITLLGLCLGIGAGVTYLRRRLL